MKSFLGNFYRHLAIFYWSHCNCSQKTKRLKSVSLKKLLLFIFGHLFIRPLKWTENGNFVQTKFKWRAVLPDWAIYWTLGNFYRHLAIFIWSNWWRVVWLWHTWQCGHFLKASLFYYFQSKREVGTMCCLPELEGSYVEKLAIVVSPFLSTAWLNSKTKHVLSGY